MCGCDSGSWQPVELCEEILVRLVAHSPVEWRMGCECRRALLACGVGYCGTRLSSVNVLVRISLSRARSIEAVLGLHLTVCMGADDECLKTVALSICFRLAFSIPVHTQQDLGKVKISCRMDWPIALFALV